MSAEFKISSICSNQNFYLIGSGLHNAVLARELANAGYKVEIFDQRNHIGGNCYDETDHETGILFHVYGPHILHFSDKKILKYLAQYAEFVPFHHSVRSIYKNKAYQIPINLETINSFFNCNLKPSQVEDFLRDKKSVYEQPRNLEEQCLSLIGKDLYEAFFKEYTIKQWGKDPKELPASTIARIPIRNNYNSSYYNKPYSYIPIKGFTNLISSILSHDNISIQLNAKINLKDLIQLTKRGIVIFTGPLDELFEYKVGKLEYRSLIFQKAIINSRDFQGISVVNYPELKYPWTRITEPKHFPHEINIANSTDKTLILKEISVNHTKDLEAYYPINNESNIALSNRYKKMLAEIGNTFAAGRLGDYKYTDMENTIHNAIKLAKYILNQ